MDETDRLGRRPGAPNDGLVERAAVHAALGEPVRLAIVDELSLTDRSPTELAERTGVPSNLLAHHLDALEAVGLIERLVSSGDRRRRYVRLRHDPLAELAPLGARSVERVLFVCSHNSARSQLAAAMWSARTGGAARSAGTHPADAVHPGAIAAGRRIGVDLSGGRPSRLDTLDDDEQVVTVCDRAHEELDVSPGWWHWSLPDPVAIGTDAAFDAVVAQLDDRIRAVAD